MEMSKVSENLAKKLRFLYIDNQKTDYTNASQVSVSNVNRFSFLLSRKGVKCQDKIISLLKKEFDPGDKIVSDVYLKNLIKESVRKLSPFERANVYEHALKEANNIIDELSTGYKEFNILVPLQNFKTSVDKFNIGKVVFSSINIESYELVKHLSKNPALQKSIEKFNHNIVAQITVETKDSKKAEEIALSELELSLDVIRFYSMYIHLDSGHLSRNKFGLDGHLFSGNSLMMSYEKKAPGSGNLISARQGYLYPFDFTKEFQENMYRLNFEILDTILKKNDSDRTKFENRIIQAIRISGSSFMSYENYDAVLKMIIALESLLLDEREPKIDNLSERTALLIATNYIDRIKTLYKMKKLYKLRNNIVHQGITVVDIKHRIQLQYFTVSCIVLILEKYQTEKIMNIKDFKKWIYKLKFSNK